MKIKKLGHCCLLIEEGGLTIVTDPGVWTTAQDKIKGVDVVLVTHEHADHFHLTSLKKILRNNPGAKIFTNRGVGNILKQEKIDYELLEDGQVTTFKKVYISGHGRLHGRVHPLVPRVSNTGYLVANKFYYPGDAFVNPEKSVEILALPIIGPFMKMSEALDFVKEIRPNVCFPVHEGMIDPVEWVYKAPALVIPKESKANFEVIKPGKSKRF